MPNWRYPSFDWDDGNTEHILERHNVYQDEVEAVFRNNGHVYRKGNRYIAIGRDDSGQLLFIVCEIRASKVRPISARLANDAERRLYERHRR